MASGIVGLLRTSSTNPELVETQAKDVQQFILGRVDGPLQALDLEPAEIPDSFDLLLEGVIDSFGIVELIGALEERYGFELDFDELAPDDMTRIGPLSSYVARKLNGR
jgi:acyl carrier protein